MPCLNRSKLKDHVEYRKQTYFPYIELPISFNAIQSITIGPTAMPEELRDFCKYCYAVRGIRFALPIYKLLKHHISLNRRSVSEEAITINYKNGIIHTNDTAALYRAAVSLVLPQSVLGRCVFGMFD